MWPLVERLEVSRGWGRMGITHIRLVLAIRDQLTGALRAAWTLRVQKNSAGSRKRHRQPRT